MMKYKEFFKDKRITVMGLGLLGRGVGDVKFLAECGADLIVTDLKTETELAESLAKLKNLKTYKPINFHLGGHRLEDFSGKNGQAPDFILKAAGVPLDSSFISEARKNGVPVEMDASLFLKLAPKVNFIGVTGTRGKTTTTLLIFEIIKEALGVRGLGDSKSKVFLAGNIKDTATLPLLKKVKAGDFVVAELDSWQLQGFHDSKISPQVSVFTTFFDDHLVYYKGNQDLYFSDKEAIFKYQKISDTLVVGEQAAARVGRARPPVAPIIARATDIPEDWRLRILGEHNRANVACAVAAARALGISNAIIKKAVESFKGVEGRLELVRTLRGVKIYNDTTATTPEATVAGLQALGTRQEGIRNNIILICGGSDKGLDMSKLMEEIPKYCKAVFLLPGTGTEKLLVTYNAKLVTTEKDSLVTLHATRYTLHNVPLYEMKTLKHCIEQAVSITTRGDIVLFSPAFASFGMFKNEYDRGGQFNKIVKSLKSS
jgi:UDP-N-acetylmuramoylalanine--D-glutamate ligase